MGPVIMFFWDQTLLLTASKVTRFVIGRTHFQNLNETLQVDIHNFTEEGPETDTETSETPANGLFSNRLPPKVEVSEKHK